MFANGSATRIDDQTAARSFSGEDRPDPTRSRGADELLGAHPRILRIKEDVLRVAAEDVPVLIEGETGTGKELLAREIHRHSRRASAPIVPVNCASLSSELIESELFGHERGAYTGAIGARTGKVAAAHRGTLFLDEIGDLPLALQGRLLRFLQNGEVQRVGRDVPIKVDVRVIAATNHDLESCVARRTFRIDLYYRLNCVRFCLPPLRERRSDVLTLARSFLERFGRAFERGRLELDAGAIALLESCPWPGNVRELENAMQAVALFATGTAVTRADLSRVLLHPPGAPVRLHQRPAGTASADAVRSPSAPLRRLAPFAAQSELTLALLREHTGNVARVARELGVSRPTLYKRLRRDHIDPTTFRPSAGRGS